MQTPNTMTLSNIFARPVARILFVVVALGAGSGCVTVQPWERSKLASDVMASPDPQELKLDGHVHEYREGSIGGAGVTGGGCGCN